MNKVFLSGKLGREPEIKQTSLGILICNLAVATSENVKKGDKWEKETEWHNAVVFGGRGEFIAKSAQKGSGIVLTGRIKTEKWEKNGEKKNKVVIIADEIEIVSGWAEKKETAEGSFNKELEKENVRLSADQEINSDDDLPF